MVNLNELHFKLSATVKQWKAEWHHSRNDEILRLTQELRDEILSLEKLEIGGTPAEQAWTKNRMEVRDFLLKHDPWKFYRSGTLQHTMVVGNCGYCLKELSVLEADKEWATRWERAVCEDDIIRLPTHSRYGRSSGNSIHHVHHLFQLESTTKRRMDEFETIIEFGGGYGNVCRIVHKLGFRGRYLILDLPEFSALQRFYLQANQLPVLPRGANTGEKCGISCVSDNDELRDALGGESIDLFLATWSFSETPVNLRNSFRDFLDRATVWLIAYQNKFEDVDNLRYFRDLAQSSKGQIWDWEIPFLQGNRYLIRDAAPRAAQVESESES